MSDSDRTRWNAKYAKAAPAKRVEPDEWLVEALEVITRSGDNLDQSGFDLPRALELACGLGHNALWLAQQGWLVDAVDISSAGLRLARQAAQTAAGKNKTAEKNTVRWIEADLDHWRGARDNYTLAIVFRFLDRHSLPRIVQQSVAPGGWLIYETFSRAHCDRPDSHIQNPDYTLAPGELPTLFPQFEVVVHREEQLSDRTVERFLGRRIERPETAVLPARPDVTEE